MTRRLPQHIAPVVLTFIVACGAPPEEELHDLIDDGPPTFTVRDCTCGDEAVAAASYSERFDNWPDYEECLESNRDAISSLSTRAASNQAFLLEYLDPRGDTPSRAYWHHDTRWGTHYYYVSCQDVPAGDDCGWLDRDFDEIHLSPANHHFPTCDDDNGDDSDNGIESAIITVSTDTIPARTLPERLIREADD